MRLPRPAELRYQIRKHPFVKRAVYMLPNMYYAARTALGINAIASPSTVAPPGSVAMCLRFRDEARYLAEWLDYYLAAGIAHFFLYNNFSKDDFDSVLSPYISAGRVTLIDWPRAPASPAAENDCIARTAGRFEWVGFFDADEFVVIADGRSIPEFLAEFPHACGLALHNYHFGSSGHLTRPADLVTNAYTRRESEPNIHFKVFVRPERVSRNRNSHNFYYRGAHCAVNELGRSVYGSMGEPPTARCAWHNHYLYKSREDYLEKAMRKSTLDRSGMTEPGRIAEQADHAMMISNDVVDTSAREYFAKRKKLTSDSKRFREIFRD